MARTQYWKYLRACPIHSKLNNRELMDFLEEVRPVERVCEKDVVIIGESDYDPTYSIVCRGRFRGEKYYYSGDVHLVRTYGEGEIINLACAVSRTKLSPVTVVASTNEAVLMTFRVDQVQNSKYYDRISEGFLEYLADVDIQSMEKINILSRSGIRTGCSCT